MSAQRTWSLLLLPALVVAGIGLGTTTAAAATVVPGEVSRYIATGLIDDLNEFYGPGTDGNGRLFTNATTTSPGTRVFEFTPDFLAGVVGDPAIRRVNEWVSVISIDKLPVGFAVVSVDPLTTKPQLANFTESDAFGVAIAELAETATLVHDNERAAWLSLEGDELTPILTGSSGTTGPVSIDDYRVIVEHDLRDAVDVAPAPTNDNSGLIIAALILALIVVLLAAEASLPYWRRRAAERRAPGAHVALEPAHDAEPAPDLESAPDAEPAPKPEAAEVKAAPTKARAGRAKPTAST